MTSSVSSRRGSFLVIGLIIGIIIGAQIGNPFSDADTINQISNLKNELKAKDYLISNLQKQISTMQQQITNLQNELQNKNVQISNLQQQNEDLRKEIIRIINSINSTRIVQSENYLLRMEGTLHERKSVWEDSTYFTTIGKQLKIVIRLSANQKVIAKFTDCEIRIAYNYGGKNFYPWQMDLPFRNSEWDFNNGDLIETMFIKLTGIPDDILGKAPLFLILRLNLFYPKFDGNPSFFITYELTVYDVYPP